MSLKLPTIICSITSGLGNQLFQYAAGLHWQKNHGGRLLLDTSWYWIQKHKPNRTFKLGLFDIQEKEALLSTETMLFCMRNLGKTPFGKSINSLAQKSGMHIVMENDAHKKDARYLSCNHSGSTTWLQGYWQTSDHYLAVRDLLKERLKPSFQVSNGFKLLNSAIKNTPSVFIHVRRGDYATLGHGMLTPKYYVDAVERFPAGMNWFVFSEDLNWCRENLVLPGIIHYVDYASENRDEEDLLLMSECHGGVIANSSFSWWGAAIGDHDKRLIIAPKFRHGPEEGDLQLHRLLPNWVTIESF